MHRKMDETSVIFEYVALPDVMSRKQSENGLY